MTSRIETLFALARAHAAQKLRWISKVRVVFCDKADDWHRMKWRYFAHSGHLGVYTVCFARAAESELTDEEALGISAHELGHVVAIRDGWPEHKYGTFRSAAIESEANRIASRKLGFRGLRYNLRTLEELKVL